MFKPVLSDAMPLARPEARFGRRALFWTLAVAIGIDLLVILMYTDGIPEIALPNWNPMGIRRFAQIYESTRDRDLGDAAATIVQMAEQVQDGKPQTDDWTFILIEWTG